MDWKTKPAEAIVNEKKEIINLKMQNSVFTQPVKPTAILRIQYNSDFNS
jgi:hypothetical protein